MRASHFCRRNSGSQNCELQLCDTTYAKPSQIGYQQVSTGPEQTHDPVSSEHIAVH
jgi:hypothetical protein